jgi:hypothetical protein
MRSPVVAVALSLIFVGVFAFFAVPLHLPQPLRWAFHNGYLLLHRMNMVRRALQQSTPRTLKIAEIATRHGFWQFERLAVEERSTPQMAGHPPILPNGDGRAPEYLGMALIACGVLALLTIQDSIGRSSVRHPRAPAELENLHRKLETPDQSRIPVSCIFAEIA